MLEGISTNVSGTVAGRPLRNPQLVVAEATDEAYLALLPLVLRET
jgi:hypothetical protein